MMHSRYTLLEIIYLFRLDDVWVQDVLVLHVNLFNYVFRLRQVNQVVQMDCVQMLLAIPYYVI